jgi:hypothetical protein
MVFNTLFTISSACCGLFTIILNYDVNPSKKKKHISLIIHQTIKSSDANEASPVVRLLSAW